MKACRASGPLSPFIRNRGSSWRLMVSLRARPVCLQRNTSVVIEQEVGGPLHLPGRFDKDRISEGLVIPNIKNKL